MELTSGININVNATLSVDDRTFRTCMNLISIYAESRGIKGMVIKFDENDGFGPTYKELMTDEEAEEALGIHFEKED